MFLKLTEPEWWKKFLQFANDFVDKNEFLSKTIPITADIFVFTYPLYLIYLYIYWIFNKDINYKYASLYIFFSGVSSMFVSQMFQFFVIKDRPEDHISSKKNLILEHLPDISFPSDHMTLSIAIATSSLLWWIKRKNKFFINISFLLFIFAFVMWFSRIAWGIHWPTDIIAWFFLWILLPFVLINTKIFNFFKRFIYNPLIKLQEFIFKHIFKIN